MISFTHGKDVGVFLRTDQCLQSSSVTATRLTLYVKNEYTNAWSAIGSSIPRPRAVICVSAHFEETGELSARSNRAVDDARRASCVDWYGNARPLFVHGRVLALLGYEIVEGTDDDGRMRELRRVNYAPRRMEITRR